MDDQTNIKLEVLELQWRPEMDSVRASKLMKPTRDSTSEQFLLERMWVLCAIQMHSQLQAAKCAKPHFDRYRSWLAEEYENFKLPGYLMVPDSAEIIAMSDEDRHKIILEIYESGKGTHMWPVLETAWRVYLNMIEVVEGRRKLLKVLMEDRLLPQFYDWANDLTDVRPLFKIMGHSKPQLRVLEIGAGTGGATARSLDGLTSETGERLYSSYTFTDISTLFFEPARERFKQYEAIEFKKLDISIDPQDQGFEPGVYDLILASNVLHATPSLVQTLRHCRMLLKPDGYLYMQELSQPGKFIQFIVGLFPGWWLGDDDGRPGGPCVPPMEWDRRLRQSGFDGIHTVAYDNEPPYYYTANMLARPVENVARDQRVTLLTQSEDLTEFGQIVKDTLVHDGLQVEQRPWSSELPKGHDIISLVDIERSKPLLQDITQEDLSYFKHILQDKSDAVILWAMPPAQVNCQNPHCGQMLGVARSLHIELGLDFATLELQTTTNQAEAALAVAQVYRKIRRTRAIKGGSNLDTEYIWIAGQIHVGRFYRLQTTSDLTAATPLSKGDSLIDAHQSLVSIPDTPPLTPLDPAPLLKSDASYLLVGELKNLCRAAASWMTAAGARDLIVLSPSGGKSDPDQAFVDSLKKAGCSLRCFEGEAADRDFIQGIISRNKRRITGVIQIHMATTPLGKGFTHADHRSWTTALRPKIEGTWNLHQMLPIDLDFFVLTSTNGGMLGLQRQSNTASANSFFDAFSEYRNGLGLPASVLHVSGIDEGRLTNIERDFLRGLQLAVARSAGAKQARSFAINHPNHTCRRLDQIVLASSDQTQQQSPVTQYYDARMAVYHNHHVVRVAAVKNGAGEGIQTMSAA